MRAAPDLTTLRRVAWLPGTALVLCDLFSEPGGEPVEVAPRRLLQRQLAQARELGYTVMGGSELEFYVFNETYDTAREKRLSRAEQSAAAYVEDYHIFQGTREEGLLRAIRQGLDASGVPSKSTKGEWGPGQQELNLTYSEALTQADRKFCAGMARERSRMAQEKAVTFMAKWDEKLAGSGMHVHISLWDLERQQNLFAGDGMLGDIPCSDAFRWFLGGWWRTPAISRPGSRPMSTPISGSSPARLRRPASPGAKTTGRPAACCGAWPFASDRVPHSRRGRQPLPCLCRRLAAGLEGVRTQIEPPPAFSGDIYQADRLPRIPGSLRDAIDAFAGSELAHARPRVRGRGALPALSSYRAAQVRRSSDRLGEVPVSSRECKRRICDCKGKWP